MTDRTPKKRKPDKPTERLRVILDGTGDQLPRVGLDTQRQFHAYLAEHLSFPFEGRLTGKGVPRHQVVAHEDERPGADPARSRNGG